MVERTFISVTATMTIMNPWVEDLKELVDSIKSIHPNPYRHHSDDHWNKIIAQVHSQLLSDREDHLKITEYFKIVALLGDSHSRIGMRFTDDHHKMGMVLPDQLNLSYAIETRVFDDGVYVIKAKNPEFLGKQLIEINEIPIREIGLRLRPYLPVENDSGFIAYLPLFLRRAVFLHTCDIVGNLQEQIECKFADGSRALLLPETEPEMNDLFEWQNAENNANATRSLPKYLRYEPPLSIRQEEDDLIVDIRSIQDSEELSMRELATNLNEELERSKPDDDNPDGSIQRLIIDIRENGGGNNFLNQPLVRTIIRHPWIDYPGRLIVLINRWTFSAAINLATELERNTWAIFAGEPFAGKVNHYGDSTEIQLKNSGLKVKISTLYWQDSDPGDMRESIMPDIPIRLTFNEYVNREDPALDIIRDFQIGENWLEFYTTYPPRAKRFRENQKQKIETYFSQVQETDNITN